MTPSGPTRGPDQPPGGPRVTANLFGVPFGFAGLALAWRAGDQQDVGVPRWPAVVLVVVASVLLVGLAAVWLAQLRRVPLTEELDDAVLAPFLALAPCVAVLVGSALLGYGIGAGRALVVVGVVVIALLAAWLLGGWVLGSVPWEAIHPGWFLPTVAGGLLSGSGLAEAGWHRPAVAAYAVGLAFLVVLGGMILTRLVVGPPVPERLVPTLFVMASPTAVAGNAWLVVAGPRVDAMQLALGGSTVLLVMLQARLLPLYRRTPFAASSWSFSFSAAAIATYAVHWLRLGDVPGRPVLVWAVLAAITAFFGWLVVRSALLLRAGTFLARWPEPRVSRPR